MSINKCDYCGKPVKTGFRIDYGQVNERFGVNYYFSSIYHEKCFNKNFIFIDVTESREFRRICNKEIKIGDHVIRKDRVIFNKICTFTDFILYYHKDCFEKYWMLPPIKNNKPNGSYATIR